MTTPGYLQAASVGNFEESENSPIKPKTTTEFKEGRIH